MTALTGHGKLSRRVCVARPSRGERRAPLPAELGAADGPTGRFRADLGPFCLVMGQNRARGGSILKPPPLKASWSHHLEPQSWLRTLSLRSVPRYVSPLFGERYPVQTGQVGAGGSPTGLLLVCGTLIIAVTA